MATMSPGRPRAARPRPRAARRGCLPAQLLERALARVLVLAPAHELRAMADAVARDVVEVDLDYELWPQALPHEFLVGLPATRLAAAALVRPVWLEQRGKLALLLGREAGGVADHVELAGVVVGPEDERTQRALRLAEAEGGDHQIGRANALDLRHAQPLTGLV